MVKKTPKQGTLKFEVVGQQSEPPQSMEVVDSEGVPQPPPLSPPPSPSPSMKVVDLEGVPQSPQPSTSQVEDDEKQEDTKRIKKLMGGQILKLLGRVVVGVKSMSEDIAVLNSKVDKIAETSCLHYKPTFYVDNDEPMSAKYGCTLF